MAPHFSNLLETSIFPALKMKDKVNSLVGLKRKLFPHDNISAKYTYRFLAIDFHDYVKLVLSVPSMLKMMGMY